jgi:hypothetical protein
LQRKGKGYKMIIEKKYESLLAERHDAIDMLEDVREQNMNDLIKIEELSRPYDSLYEAFEELAYKLSTTEWKEKKKTTNFNAWELAIDSVRKEIMIILQEGKIKE